VWVVLASRYDATAAQLVAGWPPETRLLTCRDLSTKGWRYSPGGAPGVAVIGGVRVPVGEIEGVLTRLPAVGESELVGIVSQDRSYVAAEMTAFLTAWLSELPCPVLNSPTPGQLMGRSWTREQWLLTAIELGIPAAAMRLSVPPPLDSPLVAPARGAATVTVVCGRALGVAARSSARAALSLAEAAGAELLRAHFESAEEDAGFVDADYWVDVSDPAVAAAVLACLRERTRQ
jgi:hypothetical protein